MPRTKRRTILRRLRDLRALPDDQTYLCHDKVTADKHGLPLPFRCGCRLWLGGGVVRVYFWSRSFSDERWQESSVVLLTDLEPVKGTWVFTD
jgi:hypothetical protein